MSEPMVKLKEMRFVVLLAYAGATEKINTTLKTASSAAWDWKDLRQGFKHEYINKEDGGDSFVDPVFLDTNESKELFDNMGYY